MARYDANSIITNPDTGEKFLATYDKTFDPESATYDIIIQVGYNELLENIAARYLGDASKWWQIAELNGMANAYDFPENRKLKIKY
jgi:hypothetical protein